MLSYPDQTPWQCVDLASLTYIPRRKIKIGLCFQPLMFLWKEIPSPTWHYSGPLWMRTLGQGDHNEQEGTLDVLHTRVLARSQTHCYPAN